MKLKIGFIGLGIMGTPMVKHLLSAGHEVTVGDINSESVERLVSEGAIAGSSPREISFSKDFVITMLPDSPDVKTVALGKDGIIEGIKSDTVYIDMSTIAPSAAVEVHDALMGKGVNCLDAPVSGGQSGAENASLSIMVGGNEEVFAKAMPVLNLLGKTVTYCGKKGSGQIVKACNQIQVAINFAGLAEALVLGSKAGVDPSIIIKVLSGGYAQTKVMEVRGPEIIRRNFEPGFKSRFHYKDLNIVMKSALDFEVPLPVTSVVHELFTSMMVKKRGELDHSAIITILEDMANVKVETQL